MNNNLFSNVDIDTSNQWLLEIALPQCTSYLLKFNVRTLKVKVRSKYTKQHFSA